MDSLARIMEISPGALAGSWFDSRPVARKEFGGTLCTPPAQFAKAEREWQSHKYGIPSGGPSPKTPKTDQIRHILLPGTPICSAPKQFAFHGRGSYLRKIINRGAVTRTTIRDFSYVLLPHASTQNLLSTHADQLVELSPEEYGHSIPQRELQRPVTPEL
jgi:hypothetical protein